MAFHYTPEQIVSSSRKATRLFLMAKLGNTPLGKAPLNGIDTLVFRKGLEEISAPAKVELLEYAKQHLSSHASLKQIVKETIDSYEMNSGFYRNSPRFRGAYSAVVAKTFAGVMLSMM